VYVEELRVSALTALDDSRDDHGGAEKRNARVPAPVAPAARFVDLPKGTLVGDYEIERKIGEGGMGAVFAAVHGVLGKRVAIKIIGEDVSRDVGAVARFRREARVVAQLASSHIVDVFGFGELADGRAYFVMEHLIGESLRDRLARGRVPLDEALDIVEQVARGLEAAHEAGVVHRDLKPENIFLERGRGATPTAKLLDFGIVKLAAHDENVAKTQAGVLIGTPMYVAPEQIRAAGDVDHRADIYALGGVAFELVLGRPPFVRSTVVELVAAHLECPAPRASSLWPAVPQALDSLLGAMLAKDPSKRPTLGHVQEAIEKLRRTMSARPQPAADSPTILSTPARRSVAIATVKTTSRWRRRAIAIAVGIAVLVAMILIATAHEDATLDSASAPATDHIALAKDVRVSPIEPVATAPPLATTTLPPSEQPPVPALPMPRASSSREQTPTSPRTASASIATAPRPSDGELEISAKPPCDVSIDGKPLGRKTPIIGLAVDAGIHRVTLENVQYRIEESVSVQVLAGKRARVIQDYSARLSRVDPNGTIDPFGVGKGSSR
jgi:serine/threonine-protein kinase